MVELSRVLNAKDMKVSEKLAFISHLVGSSDPREIRFYDRLRKSNSISDDEVESAAPLFTRKSIWAPASPVFSFIDLFAGIGGMRIAAEQAGGKCVFSSEWDPFAKMTYLANFGVIPFGDITKISASDVPKYDVLLAGFPCQTFSSAGLKAGFEDTRGTMFFEVERILGASKPKAFVLENVKGLRSHDNGKTLAIILEVLREKLGYFVMDPIILNSRDFGLPQNRERIFIVGFKKYSHFEKFAFPGASKKPVKLSSILERKPVAPKYYLSAKLLKTLEAHRTRHNRAGNGFGMSILDNDDIANALLVGGMGTERNLIVDKRLKTFDSGNPRKGKLNKEFVRKLTPREWARLQGFQERFVIPVSDTQAYKQFGNSVSIPVVNAILKNVMESISAS